MLLPANQQTIRHLASSLQTRINELERDRKPCAGDVVTSGFTALDGILTARGFRRGTLVEWLFDEAGCGAGLLALVCGQRACRNGRALVVVDRRGIFYPPAAFSLGIRPAELIIIRPRASPDEQWAIDQVLRSPAVGAVLAWPQRLDSHTFRRWQLAAETSGVLGCLVRQSSVRGDPTWADVRLRVKPRQSATAPQWRLQVEVLYCRGQGRKNAAELVVCERVGPTNETSAMPVAAELAHSATPANSLRA